MHSHRIEAAVALLAMLATGCGVAVDSLEVASGDVVSSGRTAHLAAEDLRSGQITATASTVMIDNATAEAASALRSLADLPLTGERDLLRDQLLAQSVALVGWLHDLDDAIASDDQRRIDTSSKAIESIAHNLDTLHSEVRSSR